MLNSFPDGYLGFVHALASGWFGATFFMLALMQKKVNEGSLTDVKDMWTWPLVGLRIAVGVSASAIIYFFFETGLLEGTLWPDLQKIGFTTVERVNEYGRTILTESLVPNSDLSLLIVWCFLAGYSQTLVPNILIKTEGRAGNAT